MTWPLAVAFAVVLAALIYTTGFITGAWLDAHVHARYDARRRRKLIDLYGADATEAWLAVAETTHQNGWSSLAPEEGEAA